MRRSVVSAMLGALLTLAVAAGPADAGSTPAATGCPSAYELLAVASFAAPYRAPAMVDGAGNGNGFVCALPLPDAKRDAVCRILADPSSPPCELQALGLPVYQFVDDDNPAADTPAGS